MAELEPSIKNPLPPQSLFTGLDNLITIALGEEGQKIACQVDQTADVARAIVDKYDEASKTAIVRMRIMKKPYRERVLLSVWRDDDSDADHQTALYGTTFPQVGWSFDRTFVSPYDFVGQGDPSTLITITVTVEDEAGNPLPNFQLKWNGNPNPPTLMVDKDGNRLPYDGTNFVSYTDGAGKSEIRVSNIDVSILKIYVYYSNNRSLAPKTLVFSNIGGVSSADVLKPPLLPQAEGDGSLNLDSIDGDFVDVQIPPYQAYSENSQAAVWLNGQIAAIAPIPKNLTIKVAKKFFITGNLNHMAYVAADPDGNPRDSAETEFEVTGTVAWQYPSQPGTLPSVYLQDGGNVINHSQIAGGLFVVVPPYDGMAPGDTVTMSVYLNAYYPGTSARRTNILTLRDQVSDGELASGMIFEFSESDVAGYGRSIVADDPVGNCQIQYQVVSPTGQVRYSTVKSFILNDVPLSKEPAESR